VFERSQISGDFADYIKKQFEKHSHLEITIRVLECLDYIQNNINEIASHAGNVSLLRHPTNHLAFHLNDLNTPQEVKDNFANLISETNTCLHGLLSIEDISIRHQIISIFLNHINDSDIGCMEVRLRNAITFYGIYISVGLISLDNLMQEFYEIYGGINKTITVENILAFFGEKVDLQLLVMNHDHQTVPLTWPLIHNYLKTVLDLDNLKNDWLDFAKKNPPLVFTEKRRNIWHTYYFDDEQKSNHYLSYVKSILSDLYQNELAKASVKKDEAGQYYFQLTDAQYKSFNETIHQHTLSAEIEKEKEVVSPSLKDSLLTINLLTIPDAIAEEIASKLEYHGALVKSVRFDHKCFNLDFRDGVTKSLVSQSEKRQRKDPHKQFTVFGTGPYHRAEKPSPYLRRSPESPYYHLPRSSKKIAKKKKKTSKHQSTSLVTRQAQTPVFGHNRERADKLVGYLFDHNDAMINRMFIYDGGTVGRPYEFDTYEEALAYFNKKSNPDHPILFSAMEKFKEAIATQKDKYNEVLARLRWNVKSSAVGIFSDSFEARCIAQLYAQQMQDRLKIQYQELGKPWDDSYQVPIIYYMPSNAKKLENLHSSRTVSR